MKTYCLKFDHIFLSRIPRIYNFISIIILSIILSSCANPYKTSFREISPSSSNPLNECKNQNVIYDEMVLPEENSRTLSQVNDFINKLNAEEIKKGYIFIGISEFLTTSVDSGKSNLIYF